MKRFDKVVGTGGIGTGLLFVTDDNKTLGRNESRLVFLSDAKDYCKQQIVFYYINVLVKDEIPVYPIGCVGQDAYGKMILDELSQMGMSIQYIQSDDALPTMISFCLQYPDKDGCNITASNAAGDRVSPEQIQSALNELGVDEQTLLVAIPEVRVETRMELLTRGKAGGGFCVLSIPEAEAEAFEKCDAFRLCDLLAVNEREALALAPGEGDDVALVRRLHAKISVRNPEILLVVTCGSRGAFTMQGDQLEFIPTPPVKAVNTTGAGDAFLGGLLAGMCMNLPFQKLSADSTFGETTLASAAELGALCAGMAVESEDSIAYHVTPSSIRAFIEQCGFDRTEQFDACVK